MKKGCLIAVAVFVLLLGIAVWKIASLVKKGIQIAQEFQVLVQDIQSQNEQMNRKFPFAEPNQITLTDQQMQAFMAIRRQLNDTISVSPFLQKMKELDQMEETGADASFSDIA